jgi:lipopolysaccharide/colanic/teichoic acid biosynthesis glycosyltransferase
MKGMVVITSKAEAGHAERGTGVNRAVYPQLKGIGDRLLAGVGLVAISPVLLMIAVIIRLDSPGNALFVQERVGRNGRHFKAYKFRTMFVKNDDTEYKTYLKKYVVANQPYRVDESGQAIYRVEKPPVTRVGRIMRKTNLDELPQLVNVVKGEMSLVGPRPDIPYAVAMYQDWHRGRLAVTPGMTGLWQVSGRKTLSFEDMVRLDLEYVRKQSLSLDAKILLKTVGVVLKMDGS